jgi:hypothetical protein
LRDLLKRLGGHIPAKNLGEKTKRDVVAHEHDDFTLLRVGSNSYQHRNPSCESPRAARGILKERNADEGACASQTRD